MKKIIAYTYFLVLGLTLICCNTLSGNISLLSLTKGEEFTTAYITQIEGENKLIKIDLSDLEEKEFYKNIMNSEAIFTEVIPEAIPTYSLQIKSEENVLSFDCICKYDLYAYYDGKTYLICCSNEDLDALNEYLLSKYELTESYKLDVIDNDNYLLNKQDLDKSYKPGTLITIKANVIIDVDLAMYVNGIFYSIQTVVMTDDGNIWQYQFTMPNEETKVEFKVCSIDYISL